MTALSDQLNSAGRQMSLRKGRGEYQASKIFQSISKEDLEKEYNLIVEKKSKLSKFHRDCIVLLWLKQNG